MTEPNPEAKVIKAVLRHNCQEEIAAVDHPGLYLGSIVECSCGNQFTKRDDQRDGLYWAGTPAEDLSS